MTGSLPDDSDYRGPCRPGDYSAVLRFNVQISWRHVPMSRPLALLVPVAVAAMLYAPPIGAGAQRPLGDIELPPISWSCPMNGTAMPDGTIHADVYEDAFG